MDERLIIYKHHRTQVYQTETQTVMRNRKIRRYFRPGVFNFKITEIQTAFCNNYSECQQGVIKV